MAETITKLQPDRTLYVASFTPKSAIGVIHGASASGFSVGGRFNALSDNVILEWNRDNDFEHPSIRYLPDGNFAGLTLSYDFAHSGLADIATGLFPYGDFPSLNIYTGTPETRYQIALKNYATPVTGSSHLPASASITLGGTLTTNDAVAVLFFGEAYWHTVTATDDLASVVSDLATQINGASGNMTASSAGAVLTLTTTRKGDDANLIRGYTLAVPGVGHPSPTESWSPETFQCTGGGSPAWHVVLPFDSLGIPVSDIRKLQWSLSPRLPDSASFSFSEMTATFSNWSLTGGATALKRAAPRLRFEDDSREVHLTGTWSRIAGQYSQGGYSASGAAGDHADLSYNFPDTHDLYLGTYKDTFSGIAQVTVDGASQPNVDLYSGAYSTYRARVRLAAALAPGAHNVRVTVSGAKNAASSGWNCDVDFFEAAVAADWDSPAQSYTDVGFSTDFDTAHALSLSPQRLAWGIDRLGVRGEVDHFIGIGQFAERTRVGGTFPQRVYSFSGSATPNDQVFLNFGSSSVGHYIQTGDTLETLVRALAFKINELFTGIWAAYDGPTLTVTVRDPSYSFTTSEQVIGAQTESISASGSLTGGVVGTWQIDPSISPKLNVAARTWHQEFVAELASRGIGCMLSFSAELTDPPSVFAQRYPDGAPVLTANPSTMTAFRPEALDYGKGLYLEAAQAMSAAGAVPALQFGEVQWWYFPNGAGMGYYDSYTTGQFQSLFGRPLHVFLTNNDDPAAWPDDAAFLRSQLQSHVDAIKSYVLAAYPSTRFEALWPMDANDPPTRRLNYFVNLPLNWTPANFDTFKCEAFGYTGADHDMSKAVAAIRFPIDQQGFSPSHSRHIVGLFGYPWPWERALIHARRAGLALTNLWAYDQFCFFDLALPLATEARRAQFVG